MSLFSRSQLDCTLYCITTERAGGAGEVWRSIDWTEQPKCSNVLYPVQIGQHLAMLERASSADPFHLSLSNSPGPAPADTSALALRSVAPVVHCVDSTQPITANIKLQLPRGCHLLEQWVPPGVPHGSDVDSTHVGGQAKLLVREARGDYLPVRAEVVCVEATDAMTTLHTVKVWASSVVLMLGFHKCPCDSPGSVDACCT